jgi:hypothetical protein
MTISKLSSHKFGENRAWQGGGGSYLLITFASRKGTITFQIENIFLRKTLPHSPQGKGFKLRLGDK